MENIKEVRKSLSFQIQILKILFYWKPSVDNLEVQAYIRGAHLNLINAFTWLGEALGNLTAEKAYPIGNDTGTNKAEPTQEWEKLPDDWAAVANEDFTIVIKERRAKLKDIITGLKLLQTLHLKYNNDEIRYSLKSVIEAKNLLGFILPETAEIIQPEAITSAEENRVSIEVTDEIINSDDPRAKDVISDVAPGIHLVDVNKDPDHSEIAQARNAAPDKKPAEE